MQETINIKTSRSPIRDGRSTVQAIAYICVNRILVKTKYDYTYILILFSSYHFNPVFFFAYLRAYLSIRYELIALNFTNIYAIRIFSIFIMFTYIRSVRRLRVEIT